jgi:nucleoid DNA-binding protein
MRKAGRPKKEYPTAITIEDFKKTLLKHGECILDGIGLFQLRSHKKREFPDRWTGKIIKLNPKIKIGFRADKDLEKKAQVWNSKQ